MSLQTCSIEVARHIIFAQGLTLPNTFANTPVCCPARANLLTGTYASKNGMTANDLRLRESETSIADLLGRAGYRTGFIGKWGLGGALPKSDYDYFDGFLGQGFYFGKAMPAAAAR